MKDRVRIAVSTDDLQRALALAPDHEVHAEVRAIREAIAYPDWYTSPAINEACRMRLRRTHAGVDFYPPDDAPHPVGTLGTSPPEVVAAARARCEAQGACYDCRGPIHPAGEPCPLAEKR